MEKNYNAWRAMAENGKAFVSAMNPDARQSVRQILDSSNAREISLFPCEQEGNGFMVCLRMDGTGFRTIKINRATARKFVAGPIDSPGVVLFPAAAS